MDIRAIKSAAPGRIDHRAKQLALIFVAVQAAVVLLVNLVDLLVNNQMDNAAGLAGLGTRQIWETVRTAIFFAASLALPFWSFGYLRVGMAAARGERAEKTMLLAGFQRFFPLLRLTLLRFAIFTGLSFASIYGAMFLYMLSPASAAVMAQLEEMMAQGEAAMTAEAMENLVDQMWPMYLLMAVVACVLVIPAFYRLRLADYVILDGENRALVAMRQSKFRSYTHKFQLFKLDLSFWWYYLLTALASAIVYLDLLLPRFGVSLNAEAAYWLCLIISVALQTAVGYFGIPRLYTAYAMAYDALTPKAE